MWHVRLIGPRESVEKLSHRFSDDNVKVFFDADGGVLTAVELQQFTNHMAVIARAKSLIEVFSGILSVEGDFVPVQAGSTYRMEGDKKHAFAIGEMAVASAVISGSGSVRDASGALKNSVADRTRQIPELADRDSTVADFLGRHPDHVCDWGGLYKLYEVVRNDVGGEQVLEAKGWIDPADRELFTRTANHSWAAGRAARHAASKTAPPKVPMPLGDAKHLIRRLSTRWLDQKLAGLPQKP